MGQPDSVEEFPPDNNITAVPVNKKQLDQRNKEGGGPWTFGTKWG